MANLPYFNLTFKLVPILFFIKTAPAFINVNLGCMYTHSICLDAEFICLFMN